MKDIFDISNTNVIENNGFYYFFRALNNGDNSDITQGITSSEGIITSIRPDNARFQGVPRYNAESSISLIIVPHTGSTMLIPICELSETAT